MQPGRGPGKRPLQPRVQLRHFAALCRACCRAVRPQVLDGKLLDSDLREHYINAHMSRFLLALRCFLAVLMRRPLPQTVAEQAAPLLLPESSRRPEAPAHAPSDKAGRQPDEAKPAAVSPPPAAPTVADEAKPSPAPAGLSDEDRLAACRRGAVQILSILQREGRLLDFLMENVDGYSDAQIGAAVRDIHRGCRKALSEHIKPQPIRSEADESVVRVQSGYDPSQVRLIGRVTGRPPFEGTLRHHGWRASEIHLSDIPSGHDASVICPAEVEIGA